MARKKELDEKTPLTEEYIVKIREVLGKAKESVATLSTQIDEEGILQEDVLFKSPSYAAAFVIGGHANGRTEWKTDYGKTLKYIENNEDSGETTGIIIN
jgi:hypothetical protein